MSRILKFLLPVLIVLAGIGVFSVLRATRTQLPPAQTQERVWRVEVERIAPGTYAPTLTLYGQVETPRLLRVSAPAQALVDQVPVQEGELVKKGQLLVRLDERDFLPRLEQARADVAELEAEIQSEKTRYATDRKSLVQEQALLDLARHSVDRARRMTKQKLGSESELDKSEQALAQQLLSVHKRQSAIDDHPARLQALEARLRSARARLAERRLDYERSAARSPFDGIIFKVDVTAGDQVKDNAVLVRMYALDSLWVRARIAAPYEQELFNALRQDAPVVASAELGAAEPAALRLDRIAGEADPSGVDGLFRFRSTPAWLRVGQVLRLRLRRPSQSSAIPVPFQSVYGSDRVYRLVDGRLAGAQVQVLGEFVDERGRERLLVRSDELHPDDRLVVTHLPNAIDGLRVEPLP